MIYWTHGESLTEAVAMRNMTSVLVFDYKL
jgi:hypothetical protein